MDDGQALARGMFEHWAGTALLDWPAFAHQGLRVCRLPRGAALFEQGEIHPFVYVIRRGMLRLVYRDAQGREWVKSLLIEGQFMASVSALAPGGRTSFVAETLEEAELEQLDFREISRRASLSLPWQTALSQALLVYGSRKEARERELLTLTPAQRYRALQQQSPELLRRARQQDLAAYLGITPVSLSRLKARQARAEVQADAGPGIEDQAGDQACDQAGMR